MRHSSLMVIQSILAFVQAENTDSLIDNASSLNPKFLTENLIMPEGTFVISLKESLTDIKKELAVFKEESTPIEEVPETLTGMIKIFNLFQESEKKWLNLIRLNYETRMLNSTFHHLQRVILPEIRNLLLDLSDEKLSAILNAQKGVESILDEKILVDVLAILMTFDGGFVLSEKMHDLIGEFIFFLTFFKTTRIPSNPSFDFQNRFSHANLDRSETCQDSLEAVVKSVGKSFDKYIDLLDKVERCYKDGPTMKTLYKNRGTVDSVKKLVVSMESLPMMIIHFKERNVRFSLEEINLSNFDFENKQDFNRVLEEVDQIVDLSSLKKLTLTRCNFPENSFNISDSMLEKLQNVHKWSSLYESSKAIFPSNVNMLKSLKTVYTDNWNLSTESKNAILKVESLKNISLRYWHYRGKNKNDTLEFIRELKNLNSLILSGYRLQGKDLKSIIVCLEKSPNITKLCFSSNDLDFSDDEFLEFANALGTLKSLAKFELLGYQFSKERMTTLIKAFKGMQTLKTLDIGYDSLLFNNSEEIVEFAQALKEIPGVNNLNIRFKNTSLSEIDCISALKEQPNLTNVKLLSSYYASNHEEVDCVKLAKSLNQLPKLTSVEIYSSGIKDLRSFATFIRNMPGLTKLYIFEGLINNSSDEDLDHFIEAVNSSNLKFLKLGRMFYGSLKQRVKLANSIRKDIQFIYSL